MNIADEQSLLSVITEAQRGEGYHSGTSPVTVQIGYIGASNMVCDDGILITDAPPTVLEEVLKWIKASNEHSETIQISARIYKGGVLIS